MNYLTELQFQDNIAVAEAMNAAQQLVARYLPVLRNVMQIRARAPVTDDEPTFRGAAAHKTSAPQLFEIMNQLGEQVAALEIEISQLDYTDKTFKHTEQELAEKLMAAISSAAHRCEEIYASKAVSFAMILHDLNLLSQILKEKFAHQYNLRPQMQHTDNMVILDEPSDVPDIIVEADEKLVYVRIFHREMATLAEDNVVINWIHPLLDSVKTAEKHGLAIYDNENDAKRSLKGDAYGYVTLKINSAQDITHQRPAKVDVALGCRLLIITGVEIKQMIKLTHRAIEYWIRDGLLHKIKRG